MSEQDLVEAVQLLDELYLLAEETGLQEHQDAYHQWRTVVDFFFRSREIDVRSAA